MSSTVTLERSEAAVRAFTRHGAAPRATFPLVLVSVTVAVLALHVDLVARYSETAFWAGVMLSVGLAAVVGAVVSATPEPRARAAVALALPAVFGAMVGMAVQALVLADVGTSSFDAIRDLGGLVETTQPVAWVAGGIVLGGFPALVVSIFLLGAARALRRLAGHDAGERFAVTFTGGAGLFATISLLVVDRAEAAPLVVVVLLSTVALLVTWLVDGSRIRFLRDVFAGRDGAFEVVSAEAFRADAALAPLVGHSSAEPSAARAGASSVLVRIARNPGSYRAAAAEPIGLVADTIEVAIQPLAARRRVAVALSGAMLVVAVAGCLAYV